MLRIGDFSRLARVTVKALRHYDETGLLRPAFVDPAAGYRYYRPDQLERLSRILFLKDLGFPLQEIAALLEDPQRLAAAVERRRRELASQIAADRARLKRLDALRTALAAEGEPTPVRPRSIEPALALTLRERVSLDEGGITEMFETLEARAAKARARADASPFLLFHEAEREDWLDVEACIPVKPEAEGLEGVREVPGHRKAGAIVYRGPYERTPVLFAALARWIEANGGRLAGPMREVYHRFGADQRGYRLPARVLAADPKDYVTELQAPVA